MIVQILIQTVYPNKGSVKCIFNMHIAISYAYSKFRSVN